MVRIICIIPSSCSEKILPLLHACIQSLRHASQKNTTLRIIVVSPNPSGRKILIDEPIDNFYLVDSSLGFAAMNNVAIEESKRFYYSDYYLLINDDAQVDKSFFSQLKAIVRRPADIIIPLVYAATGNDIDSFGAEYYKSGFVRNSSVLNRNTTTATAACLLIKTTFVENILRRYGYIFNPILQYYLEDTELSIRARGLSARLLKCKSLVAYHEGSTTSGKLSEFVLYHTFRNMIWVILLTWPSQVVLKNFLRIILIHFWLMLSSFRLKTSIMYFRFISETFRSFPQLLAYRKQTLLSYRPKFKFESVFTQYTFRTRKRDIPI